jgi:molybdopterin converting factor small subunit
MKTNSQNAPASQSTSDSSEVTAVASDTPEMTTVEVRCTGHIYTIVGETGFDYEFEGTTLREFLASFFEEHDVSNKLIAGTESEATTSGWAPAIDELPGENYAKNPEGEQTRPYARVAIDGRFNEHLDGLDTELEDGARVALMYPFIYCC